MENEICCDCYDIPELKKLKVNEQDLSILHLNISFLSAHIDDLQTFLKSTKIEFDIIYISESRLSTKIPATTNAEIAGYNIEQTPTDSTAGGAVLYFTKAFI